MNTKANNFKTQSLQFIDGLLVWLSFYGAAFLRNPVRELFGMGALSGDALEPLGLLLFVAIPLVPITLEFSNFYRKKHHRGFGMKEMFSGVFLSAIFLVVLMIATKIPIESRFVFLGVPPLFLTLLILRAKLYQMYRVKTAGRDERKYGVQIVGTEEEAEEFLSNVDEQFKISWIIGTPINLDQTSVDEFVDRLKLRSIARVIFVSKSVGVDRVSRAAEACESMGVEAWVASDFLRTKLTVPDIDELGGRPMIVLRSTPQLSYSTLAKKLLDRFGSLFLILLTLPLWIFAMIGIRIKSPHGSVFFRQKRAGLYGRPFTMWKFRTMHPDAEHQLDDVKNEVGNEMSGPVFKLKNDPRVFSFGSFLRKTSIDELPQLLNVLMGEMSLVGPRPLPVYEVEDFQKSEYRRRLSVKPGITCIWQASGRNSITDFEEWVKMDLEYIDNWSFWLDVKLLFQTIPAVLFSRGAK